MAEVGTFGGQLTLVSVSDGAQGDSYSVEVNHEQIYKFYEEAIGAPVYSPESFIYMAYDVDKTTPMALNTYSSELSLVGITNHFNNIRALLRRLYGYIETQEGTKTWKTMEEATFEEDGTTNSTTFKLADLFNYEVEEGSGDHHNDPVDVATFNSLLTLLSSENCYFIISIYQNFNLLVNKAVSVEFGTSDDMAKFALTANSIEMAVNNSKLEFAADGLTIRNGGISIYDDEDNIIFDYNSTKKALNIKGTGSFSGAIYAESGSFTGEVNASKLTVQSGTIGGFTITESGLYSPDQSIKLLGKGLIEADNIKLGTGAIIKRYLQLGDNAFIWNPEESGASRLFLEVRHNGADVVTLNDSGVLKLGQITMEGQTSTISGKSFSITPNLASFSNISASGKISTVVFEQGHTQSVGGLMLFKPSYKIESRNGQILTLDQPFKGAVNNYVYVIDDKGTAIPGLIQVTAINDYTVTLSTNISYDGSLVSLIDIGKANDLIIGVNSSDAPSTFLKPRGITISEFNLAGTSPKYIDENINPKVFLGDLDSSGINFSKTSGSKTRGFGLYSENVYLTGSLTTEIASQSEEPTYAGVNTLDGVPATVFTNHPGVVDDTSAIVFWAGSEGVDSGQIQASPFQVTEKGSIYASQGVFTKSIITNSDIRGSDIYAARIHGTGSEQEGYGLAFYDTSKGIVFFRGEQHDKNPKPSEVFSLGTNGLKKGDNYFIEIGSEVDFKGNNYRSIKNSIELQGYIRLYENYIAGAHTNSENTEFIDTKITLKQDEIDLGVGSNLQNIQVMQNSIKLNTTSVQMYSTVLFGEQMKYEKVSNGYNLFVLS